MLSSEAKSAGGNSAFGSVGSIAPDLTIVVVNYNTAALLPRLFSALRTASTGLNVEVIVIDNASRDDSVTVLQTQFPAVRVIKNASNVGFGRANNQAIPFAQGRYILLLNTDAFVAPDALMKTVEFLDSHKDVGVLGAKLISEDGTLQPSCRYFPTPWNIFVGSNKVGAFLGRVFTPKLKKIDDFAWDHASVRECDWVPGCYFAVRLEVMLAIGLFDPRYFLYYEEVDHCMAARKAGWKVVFYPEASVIHLGGESAATDAKLTAGRQISELSMESQLLYFRKHLGVTGALSSVALEFLNQAIKASVALAREKGSRPIADFLEWAEKMRAVVWNTRLGANPTR